MQVIFGTIERNKALEYLQKALPNYEVNDDTAKPVLDMVSDGKIRIGDPLMYGNKLPVYPEKNYTEVDGKQFQDWMLNLQKKANDG